MNRPLIGWLSLLVCTSCRYGGEGEDPRALQGIPGDVMGPDSGAPVASAPAPAQEVPTSAPTTAEDAGSAPTPEPTPMPALDTADAGDRAVSCATPIARCNPVANTGCEALLGERCTVDREAAATAGRCVYQGFATFEGECSEDTLASTCPAGTTCMANQCRDVCLCDADCAAGFCCNEPASEEPGNALGVCAPCR